MENPANFGYNPHNVDAANSLASKAIEGRGTEVIGNVSFVALSLTYRVYASTGESNTLARIALSSFCMVCEEHRMDVLEPVYDAVRDNALAIGQWHMHS